MITVEPWWKALLQDQQRNNFSDFAGASGSVTLPVPDHLLAAFLRSQFANSVRELELRAKAGNVIDVGVRLQTPAWLPRISTQIHVERQPSFPDSPVLILKLVSHGALASLAGSAARFLGALPPGLRMDGDLLFVDIPVLLRRHTVVDVMKHLKRLEITTRDGAVVVRLDAAVP